MYTATPHKGLDISCMAGSGSWYSFSFHSWWSSRFCGLAGDNGFQSFSWIKDFTHHKYLTSRFIISLFIVKGIKQNLSTKMTVNTVILPQKDPDLCALDCNKDASVTHQEWRSQLMKRKQFMRQLTTDSRYRYHWWSKLLALVSIVAMTMKKACFLYP